MSGIESFRDTLSEASPPADANLALQALWWAAKGEWDRAHGFVQQNEGDPNCDLVHAYLHRVEDDTANATYWYRRAGRTLPDMKLQDEWTALTTDLLDRR